MSTVERHSRTASGEYRTPDPQSIDTVGTDHTPAVTHTTQQPGYTPEPLTAQCGACGKVISALETCWMWQGHAFCDSQSCKPKRAAK